MKLVSAEFENFRLLRKLHLDFSMSEQKRLTVIRAENETGKTTVLTGLQWALYGDDALPRKGRDFRLHPIDWESSEGSSRVPISVQVDFETTSFRQNRFETKYRYRVTRSTTETLNGNDWRRSPSSIKLHRLEDSGSVEERHPEAIVKEELPEELREVFFTDGDRALNFIEATSMADKRDRVQSAIQSLLGLGVLENAQKHVKRTSTDINKAAKEFGSNDELTRIVEDIESHDTESGELEKKIEDSKQQSSAFEGKIADTQKEIDAALIKGDREKLKQDIEETRKQLKQLDKQLDATAKDHANIFKGLPLARDLLAPVLDNALDKLSDLEKQGQIPSTTIPVLEDRLKGDECICGESLDKDRPDGWKRREHIQCLIDESRKADELQHVITDLYFGSRSLQSDEIADDGRWIAEYTRVSEYRGKLDSLREDHGKKLKALEAQLDDIPDTNIQGLREMMRDYENQRERFRDERVRSETRLEHLKEVKSSLEKKRERLLREQKKGTRVLAELAVVQDVSDVLKRSYDRITNEELAKVSNLMNELFLEMIVADPEQGDIRRTKISEAFDIVAYGPNDRELNPDRDLNGAARRALTLAFILALTRVSKVEAPNVIDTPLGMMSGHVKQSVLTTAVRESSQLVLFLTRAEIRDCEKIIDREAGQIVTLTNPAHYPRMLVNDPNVKEHTVLRCECSHDRDCPVCKRKEDMEPQTEIAS